MSFFVQHPVDNLIIVLPPYVRYVGEESGWKDCPDGRLVFEFCVHRSCELEHRPQQTVPLGALLKASWEEPVEIQFFADNGQVIDHKATSCKEVGQELLVVWANLMFLPNDNDKNGGEIICPHCKKQVLPEYRVEQGSGWIGIITESRCDGSVTAGLDWSSEFDLDVEGYIQCPECKEEIFRNLESLEELLSHVSETDPNEAEGPCA